MVTDIYKWEHKITPFQRHGREISVLKVAFCNDLCMNVLQEQKRGHYTPRVGCDGTPRVTYQDTPRVGYNCHPRVGYLQPSYRGFFATLKQW